MFGSSSSSSSSAFAFPAATAAPRGLFDFAPHPAIPVPTISSNGVVTALKKLKCTSFKCHHGSVQLDQVESKLPSILQDVKGSQDKMLAALQLLPCYLVFLSKDQRRNLLGPLVDIVKREPIELKASALEILELLVDNETEKVLIKDHNVLTHLSPLLSTTHNTARKFAFRCMYQLAKYPHNHESLVANSVIKNAVAEICKPVAQICSDACIHLLAMLVYNPLYASQLVSGGGVVPLLNLLRTPNDTPCKFISPTMRTIRKLSAHDSHALRSLINQGTIQLIAGIAATRRNMIYPRIQIEAALVACEFAHTKDTESQDLLIRAGIGEVLTACLRHPAAEVKRAAILAVEQWMYYDDRMTLFNIEFILSLVHNGVDLAPRVKDLFTSMKPIAPSTPSNQQIVALASEIRQRPDSVNAELARLRNENANLKSSLESEKNHVKYLEAALGRSSQGPTTPQTTPVKAEPPPSPTAAGIDLTGINSLDELARLDGKISEKRKLLVDQLQEAMKCSICMDNNKDASLSPCGHALCSTCAPQIVRQGKCHVCRNRVDKFSKLYL